MPIYTSSEEFKEIMTKADKEYINMVKFKKILSDKLIRIHKRHDCKHYPVVLKDKKLHFYIGDYKLKNQFSISSMKELYSDLDYNKYKEIHDLILINADEIERILYNYHSASTLYGFIKIVYDSLVEDANKIVNKFQFDFNSDIAHLFNYLTYKREPTIEPCEEPRTLSCSCKNENHVDVNYRSAVLGIILILHNAYHRKQGKYESIIPIRHDMLDQILDDIDNKINLFPIIKKKFQTLY